MANSDAPSRPSLGLAATLLLFVVALFGFLGWQYLTPPNLRSDWGLNHRAIAEYRTLFGVTTPPLAFEAFQRGFLLLLIAVWGSYFLLVSAMARPGGRPLSRRSVWVAGLIGSAALWLFWPIAFSNDLYGYLGYGRLAAVHGRNPYLTSQKALAALGDPTGPFLTWELVSPYGPLWTWLSIGTAWLTGRMGLYGQLLAMKLPAVAAVGVIAHLGARLADRIEPGRGGVTFAALALNPLLLIEGPGNGHNDLPMIALVFAGVAALAAGRPRLGALSVGSAAAVKLVPILLAPWIVAHAARTARAAPDRRRAFKAAAVAFLLVVLPLLVTYAPFWRGLETLGGIGDRWAYGQRATANRRDLFLGANLIALVVYAGASIWILRAKGEKGGAPDPTAGFLTGWALLAGAVLFSTAGGRFPWYLAWPWSAVLARWTWRYVLASFVIFGLGFVLTTRYAGF